MANSSARAAVDVGSVIADTYTIEALLGRGGMGAVFLASHRRLAGKRVAIKILHTEIEDVDVVARFKREAEIAARLNHPNIVGVIDYNIAPDGMPYLVLDYLEGETLAQRIAAGPMALDQVVPILRQVGSALAAAHRADIVHRDLKPQNIFLVPTEVAGREVEVAKVLDFGISKIRGSQTVKTQDSTLLGTPQYMAPEQATGQHALVDERTDEFALGAIVYEMLTSRPAFAGASIPEVVFKVVYEQPPPLAELAPGLPPSVIAAVNRAMAKAPEERFASVADFIEALTGQPLSVTRGQAAALPPTADVPSGKRTAGARPANQVGKATSNEAFDQTMAPGAPALAVASTAAAGAALGATVAPVAPAPIVTAAPTVDVAPRKPRRTGVIAAIVLAGVALAGGGIYVATRSSGPAPHVRGDEPVERPAKIAPPAPPPPPVVAGTPPVAPPAPPHTAAPTPPETRPPEVKVPVKPPVTRLPIKPPPPPPTPGDEGEDADLRDQLRQAAAALDRHDYDAAERIATTVINSPAGPKQRATARLIHGQVQCLARNDQEAAQIDLRALEGFRAMRQRLLHVCRSRGVITAP